MSEVRLSAKDVLAIAWQAYGKHKENDLRPTYLGLIGKVFDAARASGMPQGDIDQFVKAVKQKQVSQTAIKYAALLSALCPPLVVDQH